AGRESGDELMERGLERVTLAVHDAPALHEYPVEPAPVGLPVAAQVIVKRERRQIDGRLQLERRASLELVAKPIDPPLRQQVLEPGVPPVGTISGVAEDGGH